VQAVVSELGGERIDIVPWHPDPEVFARRSLAPARVAKVISDSERLVITAIVDEDQLSLAIGKNGQNVRLASQLIGWQIDLYGSREWLERGADLSLFGEVPEKVEEDGLETADFALSELGLEEELLAALAGAGYSTFLDIIDLELADFAKIEGIEAAAAEHLLAIIDELTVMDGDTASEAEAEEEGDEEEAKEGEETAGAEAEEAEEAVEGEEAEEAEAEEVVEGEEAEAEEAEEGEETEEEADADDALSQETDDDQDQDD
jgi:N utilization substance protein A